MKKLFILLTVMLLYQAYLAAQSEGLFALAGLLDSYDPYHNKGKTYIPDEIKPGMTTESAKSDVIKFLTKYTFIDWQFDDFNYYNDSTMVKGNRIKKNSVNVTDDYFEFTTTKEGIIKISFANIMFDEIVHDTPMGSEGHQCRLTIGKHNFATCNPGLADALFFLQRSFNIRYCKEQEETFKPLADAYRQQSEKPAMSEEQRRYFIQGNEMLEAKDAKKALSFYKRAMSMDPFSYPQAYFNMALAAEIIKNYPYAVLCMKKYLILEPDASDSRDAKDKIYAWESYFN